MVPSPLKDTNKLNHKLFGGLKGGHVDIEANGRILDFSRGACPILPVNKRPSGGFHINTSVYWDTASSKWATVIVPVSAEQMDQLQKVFDLYTEKSPYDYAVLGMRCAAASYDVLSKIGIVKNISDRNNILKNFYPKLLRKRILKQAQQNNYTIVYHAGRVSRKWEKDEGPF